MKIHKLKTWPEPFGLMEAGLKPFEIRKNDRDFKVGDILILQEWRPAEEIYTGRELLRRVESILDQEQFGLKPGFVAMAVSPVPDEMPFVVEKEKNVSATMIDLIYAAYPFKAGKPAAIRAIKAVIKKGASASFVLARTQAYAAAVKGSRRMIPHPSTWFNQERFNDDPSTWTTNGKPEVKPDYSKGF